MLERFPVPVADQFRQLVHFRQQNDQTVREYYDAKRRLENRSGLQDAHIISGRNDGVLPELELAVASLTAANPSQWLTMAQRLEAAFKGNSSRAASTYRIGYARGTKRVSLPSSKCRCCASQGLLGRMHWHNVCPNRASVSNVISEQGHCDSDPSFH